MVGAELELGATPENEQNLDGLTPRTPRNLGTDSKVFVRADGEANVNIIETTINTGPNPEQIAAKAAEVDNAALDSILNLNSFFCVAIFIGISLPAQQGAAQASADRAAGNDPPAPPLPCALHNPEDVRQTVLMLEIIAFACVLSSTLFAVGLKMVLNMNSNNKDATGDARAIRRPGQSDDTERNSLSFFRGVMLLSASGLVAAAVLLCVSMVYYVELYAGRITCSSRARKSTIPLIALTGLGMVFLLLVLFLFIKWFHQTLLQLTKSVTAKLGLRDQQKTTERKSLLPSATTV